jgi:xylulokinase
MGRYVLGLDIGSSSVKAALLDIETGKPAAIAFSPSSEMQIHSTHPGFAEQYPEMWWHEMVNALALLKRKVKWAREDVMAIGISYQMHGLVCVDNEMKPLRPAIIWCDSRAVPYGNEAFAALGSEFCLSHYLNSPGNFTLAKLKWVKEHEPELFHRIHKVMLPGDYIAMRLTGEICTTVSGLSEGIGWDFLTSALATDLLDHYGIPASMLADIVPTFGTQGTVNHEAAEILGVSVGIPVSYRAGDQPNNAFSLNVVEPGEVAATAGTSGVVYGVTDQVNYDPLSRVNSFAHVNHTATHNRLGILLCVNGTGILNSWLRTNFMGYHSYQEMNDMAAAISPGADGIRFYPFGNGAERVLGNKEPGGALEGLHFTRHHAGHVLRAAQEGIVFALQYGIEVMMEMGLDVSKVRAGHANMFLSDVFATAFANTAGCQLELYNTDGAVGAARAAGLGAGIFHTPEECFRGMEVVKTYIPDSALQRCYAHAYSNWKADLKKFL